MAIRNSALTNIGALVALQSLGATGMRLDPIRDRVSTGLRVGSAVDDASAFSIAQGARATLKAWSAVQQGLMTARPAVNIALTAAVAVSDLLNALEGKVVAYHATQDTQSRSVLQSDIDDLIDAIDRVANGSTFNGVNLVNMDQTEITAPADEGTLFMLSGGSSDTHALTGFAGTIRVDFTASGTGAGQIRLRYDGNVVASQNINPPNQSGTLSFAYPADPDQAFTVQVTGSSNLDIEYRFFLDEQNQDDAPGDFVILGGVQGSAIDIQHRSMLAEDLGLGSLNLASLQGGLAQIASARSEVAGNLAYYGSKVREIDHALDLASRIVDATDEGLGAIVDADLGRESANLAAYQAREELSLNALSIANGSSKVLLGLFREPQAEAGASRAE
jgi:flagellin